MVPVTLKLPAELKERVAASVVGTGKSIRSSMVDAIAKQTILTECPKAFITHAKTSNEDMARTGKGPPRGSTYETRHSESCLAGACFTTGSGIGGVFIEIVTVAPER